MQSLSTGLLCFLVLYILCGCAGFKDASSLSGQQSVQKTETRESTPEPTLQTDTSSPARAEKPVPVVQVPEPSFDFGKMSDDKVFVHKFLLKNVGTSELVIKKILPG